MSRQKWPLVNSRKLNTIVGVQRVERLRSTQVYRSDRTPARAAEQRAARSLGAGRIALVSIVPLFVSPNVVSYLFGASTPIESEGSLSTCKYLSNIIRITRIIMIAS